MKAKAFMNFINGLATQVEVVEGTQGQDELFHLHFDGELWGAIISHTKALIYDEENFIPTNWEQKYISMWIKKFADGDYIIDFWTSCSGADNNDRRYIIVYNN